MKTSTFLSSVLVFTSLGITSCTPRDVRIADDSVRAKIRNLNPEPAPGQANKATGEFSMGNYALAAFLMERQVEAIELVKLTNQTLAANKTQFNVTPSVKDTNGVVTVSLTSNGVTKEYATPNQGTWKTKATKILKATFKEGDIATLELQGADLTSTVRLASNENTFMKLQEDTYSLKVSAAENPKDVKIVVQSSGTITGSKEGTPITNSITLQLSLWVDRESLSSEQVLISSVSAELQYPSPDKKKTFTSKINGQALSLKADGSCHVLAGKVVGAAGQAKFDVEFEGEMITITNNKGKKWNNGLASCGHRPTVDLSRLQVN